MKRVFIIVSILLCKYSYSQYKFIIEGKVYGSENINKIYLKIQDRYSLNNYLFIDSSIVQNDSFVFSGTITKFSETASLFIKSKKKSESFNFVIDSGLNKISIHKPFDKKDNFFSTTKLPSSISNVIHRRIDSLEQYYMDTHGTYVEDLTSGVQIKVLNNIKTINEQYQREILILKEYPSSFYSIVHLYKLLHTRTFRKSPVKLIEAYKQLDRTIKATPLGIEFHEICQEILFAEKQAKAGQPVLKFTVKTDKGISFHSSSLIGSPYIIAFSATWCAPCRRFEPKLNAFYNKYKKYGLKVVYFNLDNNISKWKEHIQKGKLNWINVSESTKFEDSHIAKQFNVSGIPVYIVVDKKGIILYNSDELNDIDFTMLKSYIQKAIK